MLKVQVKLIYYFGLLGVIGLHLNLFFIELEFPYPAEYIQFWHSHATPDTGPSLRHCLEQEPGVEATSILSENRYGLLSFSIKKGLR